MNELINKSMRTLIYSLGFGCILAAMFFVLFGCGTIGIADKPTMMNKWRGEKVNVETLADINGWCNYINQGDTSQNGGHGKCVYQTEEKLRILKELGITGKRGHCLITRDDPWHPSGHAFAVAQLNGIDYLMDNGSLCDVVFPYEKVKKSVWGVTDYRVED